MKYWNVLKYFAIIFIAVSVASAVILENVYLAILGFVIGESIAIYAQYLARKNGEILDDEMISQISGKSAMMSYIISVLFFSWIGVFFIILNDRIADWAKTVGFTMLLFVLLMVAIYFASYFFMMRRATKNEE